MCVCVFGRKIQGAGGYSDKPADGAARAGRFALVIIILIRIINISDGGRGGELMRVAVLMHCDNACPLCPAPDRLDSATVAVRVRGEKIMDVSAVHSLPRPGCNPQPTGYAESSIHSFHVNK